MIDLTPLVNAFVAVLAALVTPRLISWLTAKTTTEQRRELREWAKIAVAAAEQLYKSNEGQKKKEYVCNFLTTRGLNIDYDELDKVIEAAVLELHTGLYGGVNA